MGLFSWLFASDNTRSVNKLKKTADLVMALEPKYSAMTDAELKDQTNVLKAELKSGKTLDDILVNDVKESITDIEEKAKSSGQELMIDRSYLPFKVAREYQDRKMAKWMGFFLSEHTSGLEQERNRIDYSSELSLADKLLLLNQLYSHQLTGILTVPGRTYVGKVKNLTFQLISFETKEGYISIQISDILAIDLEVEYESA